MGMLFYLLRRVFFIQLWQIFRYSSMEVSIFQYLQLIGFSNEQQIHSFEELFDRILELHDQIILSLKKSLNSDKFDIRISDISFKFSVVLISSYYHYDILFGELGNQYFLYFIISFNVNQRIDKPAIRQKIRNIQVVLVALIFELISVLLNYVSITMSDNEFIEDSLSENTGSVNISILPTVGIACIWILTNGDILPQFSKYSSYGQLASQSKVIL